MFKSLRLDGDGEGDDVEKDLPQTVNDSIAMPSLGSQQVQALAWTSRF